MKHQTDGILDVRISNLDAIQPSFQTFCHEREKKKEYVQACLDQRRRFSPFRVSCDGVLGNEAKVLQYYKTLQEASSRKSGKSYSETTNVMKSRMSIAIVRGNRHMEACEDRAFHEPNEPTSPGGGMAPALACSTIRHTTNISQE